MNKKNDDQKIEQVSINETLPHQITAPSFKNTGIQMKSPFINKYGVVIGDSKYASENSPLENWSKETDPAIMSGDEWIHPTNDIGWNSPENRDLLEKKKKPNAIPFMHPTKDVGHNDD